MANSFDVPKTGRWIVVDLDAHVITVYLDGKAVKTIEHFSIGKKGHLTTIDKTFTITTRDKHHLSHKYHNALMKYAQFFHEGQAFHAGPVTVESHGCVHLGESDAEWLWNWVAHHKVHVRLVGPYSHKVGSRDEALRTRLA